MKTFTLVRLLILWNWQLLLNYFVCLDILTNEYALCTISKQKLTHTNTFLRLPPLRNLVLSSMHLYHILYAKLVVNFELYNRKKSFFSSNWHLSEQWQIFLFMDLSLTTFKFAYTLPVLHLYCPTWNIVLCS